MIQTAEWVAEIHEKINAKDPTVINSSDRH